MSWANEKVINAWYCTRPINLQGLRQMGVKHHGIYVETDKGNFWLVHNAFDPDREEYGPIVTPETSMKKSNWTFEEFTVKKKDVTLSDCLRAMDWKGTCSKSEWVTSGTCIKAAEHLQTYLEEGPGIYTKAFLSKMH